MWAFQTALETFLFTLDTGSDKVTTKFMEESAGPLSVWNLIVQHVPDSELPEIRGLLGDALIDTYMEMYSEVTMWLEIRRMARGCKRVDSPRGPRSSLADPPAVRELLKAEIQLLLSTVRLRAEQEGRDGGADLFRYIPAVVNHASDAPGYRSDSGIHLVQGQLSESRPGSRSSLGSTTSREDIDAVRHKLNVTQIDDVVAHLRSVLTEECEALKSQVQLLQENVERDCQTQRGFTETPEPSVMELKETRRAIQMDLRRPCLSPIHPPPYPVETSLSTTSRLTALTAEQTERPLEPPRSHYWSSLPLVAAPVRTLPLTMARGQRQEHSPPPSPECAHPQTPRGRPCDRGLANRHGFSHLPGPVRSSSTLPAAGPDTRRASGPGFMARTGRTSVQPIAEGYSICDNMDSATIQTFLFPGGRRPLGPSLHRLWTVEGHEQVKGAMTNGNAFLPAPPAVQRPASRGRSVARRLSLPQVDSVVNSS